jgi:hypothetical protein
MRRNHNFGVVAVAVVAADNDVGIPVVAETMMVQFENLIHTAIEIAWRILDILRTLHLVLVEMFARVLGLATRRADSHLLGQIDLVDFRGEPLLDLDLDLDLLVVGLETHHHNSFY